jgi:predicted solute-binding protein
MKLLSKDILLEYGFSENELKTSIKIEVMTRDNFDITLKDGQYYYSNLGIDYPLKDLAGLRKFYREARNSDLLPV